MGDILRAQRHGIAPGNCGAVVDGGSLGVHGSAGNQAVCTIGRACLRNGIYFGHQHLNAVAVFIGCGLSHHPNNVVSEAAHLFGAQIDARYQVKRFCCGNAAIHQRLELRFIAAVAIKPAFAGEAGYLLVDQLLLVIAVAQAFMCVFRVDIERFEHVIAGEPLLVIGECGVGFNQRARVVGAVEVKQRLRRQAGVGRHSADFLPITALGLEGGDLNGSCIQRRQCSIAGVVGLGFKNVQLIVWLFDCFRIGRRGSALVSVFLFAPIIIINMMEIPPCTGFHGNVFGGFIIKVFNLGAWQIKLARSQNMAFIVG